METTTELQHPHDASYQMKRQAQIDELLKMDLKHLDQQLKYQIKAGAENFRDNEGIRKQMFSELQGPEIPLTTKGILDTTGGAAMIRQDLEPTLYAIFVKNFPVFDRLAKGQSNGLVHAATLVTSPESGYALGGTIFTGAESTGTVNYGQGVYAQKTFPIAVFADGRGVTLKELAAVQAGGVNYDPQKSEMSNAMTRLAMDLQNQILMGNASNAGGTSSNESGTYQAAGFDGLRGVLGSQGVFAGNNAVQVNLGNLSMTEALQTAAANAANAGGQPTLALMSLGAKQQLDIENQNNRRYNDSQNQIIPGVNASAIEWANGRLDLVPFPGNTLGQYTYSGVTTTEDIYLLDERMLTMRWLYSDNWTVLQIPVGVDSTLTEKFLVFGMWGMELVAPAFCAKVRRTA